MKKAKRYRQTDGATDQQTDRVGHRVVRTRLKRHRDHRQTDRRDRETIQQFNRSTDRESERKTHG